MKIANELTVINQFDEFKTSCNQFTNCGVQHTQCPWTMGITLGQIAYAGTFSTVTHPLLGTGKSDEEEVSESEQLTM